MGVLLPLAATLAACSTGSSAASGLAFEGDGVRFVAPPGWDIRSASELTFAAGSGLALIANQALNDDCIGSIREDCPAPVASLRDGGVLLIWLTTHCAGPACVIPDGPLTTVGGRMASIADLAESACPAIGQTEETIYVVAVSPQRLDTLVACGRSPSAATRTTLRTFLDAVDWRTP